MRLRNVDKLFLVGWIETGKKKQEKKGERREWEDFFDEISGEMKRL